jgi:hypothetical protein
VNTLPRTGMLHVGYRPAVRSPRPA